jgi:hypothetical protein
MKAKFFLFLFIVCPSLISAQFTNHWSQNFSEESSLVAGAVVGGGAGSSAIFYNPATISEISDTRLSVNMSIYSYDYLKFNNALGHNLDLYSSRLFMVPRNVSWMVKSPRYPGWSFELAYMSVANFNSESMGNYDKNIDLLKFLPGTERYTTYSYTRTEFRNDFLGFGGSKKLSESFYFGTSLFISFKSYYSMYITDLNAYPLEPVFVNGEEIPFYTASYEDNGVMKFNDYRGLMKFGFLFVKPRFSVGMNFTTPSVGNVYSDGKRIMRERGQSNITNPDTGTPMENYYIMDYAEVKEVKVNSKTPLSLSVGATIYSKDRKQVFYSTLEYFAGIDPYRMVQAEENPELSGGNVLENRDNSDWLTWVDGANPVLNAAIGMRWYLKENLMFLGGFKTNFSYKKNLDLYPFQNDLSVKSVDFDYYHLSGGLSLRIWGQDLTAGIQYKLGISKNQTQFVNFSDPVEFNFTELKALQGTRQKEMDSFVNSFTLVLAATFNFSNQKKD